jgi:cytochrome c-type biogenesis protein CcmH/NrfG
MSASCKYLGASLAIVLVRRKLKRSPYDWSLWLLLGRLYQIGHQWKQALAALEEAHKLNPENQVVIQEIASVRQAARETETKAG